MSCKLFQGNQIFIRIVRIVSKALTKISCKFFYKLIFFIYVKSSYVRETWLKHLLKYTRSVGVISK